MYLWQSVLPFQICKKSFTRRPHLEEHMILHSQDKPFKCTYCEEHFKSRFARLKHQEKFHLGIETSFWHVNTRFKVKHSPNILCPAFHSSSFYNSLFYFWGRVVWGFFVGWVFTFVFSCLFEAFSCTPKKSQNFGEEEELRLVLFGTFLHRIDSQLGSQILPEVFKRHFPFLLKHSVDFFILLIIFAG